VVSLMTNATALASAIRTHPVKAASGAVAVW
jgi:hypothetical protein